MHSKKQYITPVSLILLAGYVFSALFVSFSHNHEINGSFHDDCPACQWNLQAKDEDTVTKSFVRPLILPPYLSFEHITELIVMYSNLTDCTEIHPRGPPCPHFFS